MNIEGVEICAINAERLLRDSFTVSEPTAVGLCELATEEAAKGLMMLLIIQVKEAKKEGNRTSSASSSDFQLSARDEAKISRFLEDNREYITGLKGRLEGAFQNHPPKLDFLKFLLRYERLAFPILARDPRFSDLAASFVGPVFRPRLKGPAPGVREVREFLNSIDVDQLQELSTARSEAFYVSLYADGHLVSPNIAGPLLPWFRDLAVLTLSGLRTALAMSPRHRPRREQ